MKHVAVLIPCYNEAETITKVIADARAALPHAAIIVGDNACTDPTAARATLAGAQVIHEPRKGKGNMVRRMFREVDAEWYILVDGDATYELAKAPEMLAKAEQEDLDFVGGVRVHQSVEAYRPGHVMGNKLITGSVAWIFGRGVPDMLSGYKVLSRRFVKSFPGLCSGFDLETELAVHALELGLPTGAVQTRYFERPEGSTSKLHTYRDGFRIARLIAALMRHEKPLAFFGAIATVLAAAALVLIEPIVLTYLRTGLVPRFPTAILAMGLMLASGASGLAGIILDTVTRGRRETRMLAYLAVPARNRRESDWQVRKPAQVHALPTAVATSAPQEALQLRNAR